jgi:hypothetical protein
LRNGDCRPLRHCDLRFHTFRLEYIGVIRPDGPEECLTHLSSREIGVNLLNHVNSSSEI